MKDQRNAKTIAFIGRFPSKKAIEQKKYSYIEDYSLRLIKNTEHNLLKFYKKIVLFNENPRSFKMHIVFIEPFFSKKFFQTFSTIVVLQDIESFLFLNRLFLIFFLLKHRLYKKQVIYITHIEIPSFSYIPSVEKFLYKLFLFLPTTIVCCEERIKDRLSDFVTDTKITVIPHPISKISVSKKQTLRKKYTVSSKDFIFLTPVKTVKKEEILWLIHHINPLLKRKQTQWIILYQTLPKTVKRYIEKTIPQNKTFLFIPFTSFVELVEYTCLSDMVVFFNRRLRYADYFLSVVHSLLHPYFLSAPLSFLDEPMHTNTFTPQSLPLNQTFLQKMKYVIRNKKYHALQARIQKTLQKKRSWAAISKEYYKLIVSSV